MRSALSHSCLLEAKCNNRLWENQQFASLNFPVFSKLRQRYHAPAGHHDSYVNGDRIAEIYKAALQRPCMRVRTVPDAA